MSKFISKDYCYYSIKKVPKRLGQYSNRFQSSLLVLIAILLLGIGIASAQTNVPIETKTLDELYQEALEEGGNLVIWAGGDKPDQFDYMKDLFKARFPGIEVKSTVDLSKYHDARFDNLIEMGGVLPDILQLQTLHDYDYWKIKGLLLNYKPASWDQLYPQFNDPEGAFLGAFAVTFANYVNLDIVPHNKIPREAKDYLDPSLKGKLILTYPHDDDAVTYQFKLLKDQFGWEYIKKLIAQDPVWVRGTSMPYVAITNGWYGASFTTSWAFVQWPGINAEFNVPKKDQYLTWVQTVAIPKDAPNQKAAKLYVNWITSKDFQSKWLQYPIRKDVKSPGGYGRLVDQKNTDPVAFEKWMDNRAEIERFRAQLEVLIGPAVGVSPLELDYDTKP